MAILATADALYCSGPVFTLIKTYGWQYVFTFKEEALKTLWESIHKATATTLKRVIKRNEKGQWLLESCSYLNTLRYKNHSLNYVEYQHYMDHKEEHDQHHVHLTSLTVTADNAWGISKQGRLRWKIENEGFNTQKNHGFALRHKFARQNFNAIKNYYLLMQIGHLISQLVGLLKNFKQPFNLSGRTFTALIGDLIASLKKETIGLKSIYSYYLKHKQPRY